MKKNLQWKVVVTLIVVGGCIFLAYPFNDQKIKRGLDLKGGIHLTLGVMTDDAINIETDQEIARLEDLVGLDAVRRHLFPVRGEFPQARHQHHVRRSH